MPRVCVRPAPGAVRKRGPGLIADLPRSPTAWLIVAAVLAALASPAAAQEALDIDGTDTDAGETEIEFETRIIDHDPGTGLFMQAQFEHALSERWALGGELELEREPGAPVVADAAVISLKWRAPRSRSGFGFALQAGAGYDFQNEAAVAQAAAYLGWSDADWSLSTKLDMEQVLQRRAEPEFGYRLRLAHQLTADIEIGIESAGDLWTDDDHQHRIGPYLALPLGGEDAPELELGAFAGLNNATSDLQVRLEIEFEF